METCHVLLLAVLMGWLLWTAVFRALVSCCADRLFFSLECVFRSGMARTKFPCWLMLADYETAPATVHQRSIRVPVFPCACPRLPSSLSFIIWISWDCAFYSFVLAHPCGLQISGEIPSPPLPGWPGSKIFELTKAQHFSAACSETRLPMLAVQWINFSIKKFRVHRPNCKLQFLKFRS